MGFPTRTIAKVANNNPCELIRAFGSKSIPTETKKRTAKASRIGRASEAARRLNSDCPTIIPARNAPRAIETPKVRAEPTAIPSARTSTARVNSSRECEAATPFRIRGISRAPTTKETTPRSASFAIVNAATFPIDTTSPGAAGNMAGSKTKTITVKISSTTSQPIAIRPVGV